VLRLAVDENFNNDIVRGLLRRQPAVDLIRIQDTEVPGTDDRVVLEWAARQGRVLVTHDVQTLTHYAYERVRTNQPMPGLFEASRAVQVGAAIEDLQLIVECSEPGEWEGQVRYLPLR
jgi:Domain of unknown function (DUF5615)